MRHALSSVRFSAISASLLLPVAVFCQTGGAERIVPAPSPPPATGEHPTVKQDRRLFGIIPNYRTDALPGVYTPLSAKQKFRIAAQDSTDRGTFILAAIFAAKAQATNSNPVYGQGVAGYARYFGAASGDFILGDFMTEAIYPSLLHQDPRYFRRGAGTTGSRIGYAVKQIFWTRQDSGRGMFNFSEILGNATSTLIGTAYYRKTPTGGDIASGAAIQVGLDMGGNLLKEFAPDIRKWLTRKPHTDVSGLTPMAGAP